MSAIPVYSSQLSGAPLGTVRVWATADGIRRIAFHSGIDLAGPGEYVGTESPPDHLAQAVNQLREYLAGERREFDLALDFGAITEFQRRVYEELQRVPCGHVTTYGEIAEKLGLGPSAARAVGGAVGANPVSIVVPCHRVIGADGALHGFSGGLTRKAALLRLEGIVVDGETARSRVHPEELRLPL